MNNQEFILWLKGFVDAVDGIPTQNQWNILKEKLVEIQKQKVNLSIGTVITNGSTSTTLPKDTNISYTANLPKELLTD